MAPIQERSLTGIRLHCKGRINKVSSAFCQIRSIGGHFASFFRGPTLALAVSGCFRGGRCTADSAGIADQKDVDEHGEHDDQDQRFECECTAVMETGVEGLKWHSIHMSEKGLCHK